MAGLAALRSGAGLVTLMLPESLRPDLLGKAPELMTVWLPETPEGTADMSAAGRVLDLLSQADAVVVGPGLSTHPSTRELVRAVVEDSPAPVVLDADGINSYASDSGRLRNGRGNPIAITPHPGEMARLIDAEIAMVQERRLEVAEEFSAKNNLFTVLKGHQTVVASPGGRLYVNSTGNPGMASGGTGDILAGMMGRFAAGWRRSPGRDDREALGEFICAAVYLHGHAGDLAAAQKGEESLIATDLLGSLPESFKSLWRE
jgi:NAD(P)H-hydrate epimerase